MPAYFDHNATTPLLPAAREAWLEATDRYWQNASGLYREAGAVKRKLEEAREELAEILGTEPERILFTSGATESNNALLYQLSRTQPDGKVLSSSVEHPSVREPLKRCFGNHVKPIPVLADTTLDEEAFQQLLKTESWTLVSAMAANNECGTLLPWKKLAHACREQGIPFHCDASQWIGKLPAADFGICDYVTGSAHKFGGPKGMGFLVMQDEEETLSFLTGGPQEEGRRAGTENYPAIAAMIAALKETCELSPTIADQQSAWRDQFANNLVSKFPGARIIGAAAPRLWNTVMLVLPKHDNRKWLARLSDRGFAISTGSACSAGQDGSSVVLHSLGADHDEMRRVVRVSSGWTTTEQDWADLEHAFIQVSNELDNAPLQREKIRIKL